ncbi:hypothetical protein EIKCOROL_00453 [Eikenella corrodens ATCC 23834]|uniref:Uncharacterized protein n=1 Tax=Eikenella corrodens ATCC 23834 TaxID=546274 RepID=C0DSY0_EIKCO|nr:hypothetical protein EIKCOROL_00453 [Eikenella corrodens ATCC 23834]
MLALRMDLLNGRLLLARATVLRGMVVLKLQAKLLSQLVGMLRPTEKIQLRWVTVHQQRLTRQLTTEYKMFLIRQ